MESIETVNTTICGRCNKPKGNGEGFCNCGRPPKYNQEIIDKTREYIDCCEDENQQLIKQSGDNKNGGYESFENKLKVNLPTLEGLAYHLKVNKDTIQEWRKDHSEFSVLITELLAKQAKELINKGLSGDYNPTIAKVLLTKHGYREGIDQTTNDKEISIPISDPRAKELAEEYEQKLKENL